MVPADLVRKLRNDAGMSLRELAAASGLAASTVHRIEAGRMQPTVETLQRISEAVGARIELRAEVDSAASIVGLARSIRSDVVAGDATWPVRKAAELASRFDRADDDRRRRMIAGEPPSTGDCRWDAFVAALAEWLAVRSGLETPSWAYRPQRYLNAGWWVTPMASLRAWEYAGSPASFQNRGIYLHRDSLTNV